ncbi:MerR family transcriptional regulator [Deinococcus sonorensis]|uniref:B12-binding domain-containing protein n=2 Tax=Deinococcus sonorensis TaxID=309891 RepID=A0AAU7U802_9DEIO
MTDAATESALYTASEVEARTGVPATTLRQWERRYGLPNPRRNASGYRLYGQHDLDCIQYILQRVDEGVAVGRAAELARDHFAAPLSPHQTLVDDLTRALLHPDHPQAVRLLDHAHSRLSVEEVLMGIIQPALVQIGTRWERGEITIAHEHQASAFLRARIGQLLDMAGSSAFGPVLVAACAPGEFHELGLMVLSLVLRRRGLQVHYLGANTPLADLAMFARQMGARAVLVTLNTEEPLEAFRQQQRDLAGLNMPVFLGGLLMNRRPELAPELGGRYLGPNAVEAAEQLIRALHLPGIQGGTA